MSGRLVVAGLSALALATGCSSAATSPRASARITSTPSPAAAAGPCASVKTTTPITDVPQPCAELWAPYQVTEVPPPDILQQEHVPAAPKVVNRTNGAVSDAEAQRWADASNRDSGWYKWAYAFTQPSFLLRLVGPALIPQQDEIALGQDAKIDLPNCDLYPTMFSLYPIDSAAKAYFAKKGLPVSDSYAFVVTYDGPCRVVTAFPDGHRMSRSVFSRPTIAFQPGQLRQDPVLGDLWFGNAGGSCDDSAGPPSTWCNR